MDFQQSKKLLDKINALHKSISIEAENISSIERDLMLSYIRQFYESFLNTAPETLASPAKKTVKKAKIKKQAPPAQEYAPPKKVRIPDTLKELEVSQPTPAPPPPKPEPVPELKPEPKVVVPTPPSPAADKPAPKVKASPLGKYKTLFGNQKAAELSEKLSLRPIKDITRAIAINDRLLYVNDLFGKDTNSYSAALIKLNNFSNMEEAQNTLLEFAKQYDWLDEEKEDTARDFVKLVRRRYIK